MLSPAQKERHNYLRRLRRHKAKLEQIKAQAITELFTNHKQELMEKIDGICIRHRIPLNASIQDDILQVVFENICKYNTSKLVEAYQDNPRRLFGLAVTLAVRKGVLLDKRTASGFNHTIAQRIMHQSVLTTLDHIDVTADDTEDFNLPQMYIDDSPDLYELEHEQQSSACMWQYVRQRLSEDEEVLLNLLLQPDKPKLKGKQKKAATNLMKQLKTIITYYKKSKQWNTKKNLNKLGS